MKNTKCRIEVFSFYNHTEIASHLEKMAEKGWMIQKLSNFGWIYHRIEPKKVHFAVSYYPKASEFDPEPSEDQKQFHEFCAHTGWKLACTSAQLQVFYNEEDDPTPIETEPILEVESIHASAKKSFLPAHIMLLVLGLLQGGMFVSGLLNNPIDTLSNSARLFSGFCFLILIALCTVELSCYYNWYKRASKAAERGELLKTPSTSIFQKIVLLLVVICGVYWIISFIVTGDKMQKWIGLFVCIYMPMLIILVNAVKSFLKRRKTSRGVNRTITTITSFMLAFAMVWGMMCIMIWSSSHGLFAEDNEETYEHEGMTWVVHHDELPLSVEDLLDVDYNGYVKERYGNESIFLGKFDIRQTPRFDAENYAEIPELHYTIVTVKVPVLYEFCKDQMIDRQEDSMISRMVYKPQGAAMWGANEVYRLYDSDYSQLKNTYLLCYNRSLVEIHFDWEPTPEQMQIVGEKFSGF